MSQFHYLNENDEYIAVPNASDVEEALEEITEEVDEGLSTRLAVDMSNVDEEGVNKIKEIAESSIPFEIGKDDKGVYVDI